MDTQSNGIWAILFWMLFFGASIALVVGAWYFRLAWFGHTNKLLPTAVELENYHTDLISTYDEQENQDELVEKYFSGALFNYYAQYSTENALSSDTRSYNIYRSIVSLTIAIFLAFSSAIPFYLGDLKQEDLQDDQTVSTTATTATSAS